MIVYKETSVEELQRIVKKTQSLRLKCLGRSQTCCVCGIEGNVLRFEKHRNDESGRAHWNLYHKKDGHYLLMTQDHILPRSQGGSNRLENLQTMCYQCNINKGS